MYNYIYNIIYIYIIQCNGVSWDLRVFHWILSGSCWDLTVILYCDILDNHILVLYVHYYVIIINI